MTSFLLAAMLLTAQQHHTAHHTFEDVDRWAAEFEDPERDAWQKPQEVVERMALEIGDRVADIGAGTGYFARRFADVVGAEGVVYAVDLEPNMLRYMAERAVDEGQDNLVPVLATAEDPMLAPDSVDVIFICDTIHHIGNRGAYYEKLQQDLEPGGRLIIVDFNKDKDIPQGPPKHMRLSRAALREELEASGFRFLKEEDFLPYQYFVVFENPE